MDTLMTLCRTNRNGTSTKNLVAAANKLGYSVLLVEFATLTHLTNALKYKPNHPRAVLVSYLYDLDEKDNPHPESGHWAMVSSFSPSKNRIVLLDSASAQKKSYAWADFRSRWMDFDLKRRKISARSKRYKLVRKWQQQLLFIMARDPKDLPRFADSRTQLFSI